MPFTKINYPLWTAIVTPFNQDLTIDFDSFRTILKEQEKANNGIVLLGSTGENLSLDEKEKEAIVDFAISLNLEVPLMVGIQGFHLPSAKNFIHKMNQKKINCYLMVTPIYAKPNEIGQYEWFNELMSSAKFPCMLYNVPSRSGTSLNLNACLKLKDHQNFWAIKEASGSVEVFSQYKKNLPNIKMYCGDDGLMPEFAHAGAVGLVSVAGNAWPKETRHYTQLCLNNDIKHVKDLWHHASNSLFSVSNPIPVKGLMQIQEKIKSANTRPPLSSQDLSNQEELKKYNQEIINWGIHERI